MLPFLSELQSPATLIHGADVLIRMTVMLSVGCGIAFCLRRRSAAFRHGWWLATLLAAVCVPAASLAIPGWGPANPLLSRFEPAPVAATSAITAPPQPTAAASEALSDAVVASSPADDRRAKETRPRRERRTAHPARLTERRPSTETTDEPAVVESGASLEPARAGNRLSPVLGGLIGIWLVGFLLVLLQTVLGWRRLSRLVRGAGQITGPQWRRLAADVMAQIGVRRSVELRQSTDETGPLTGGLINPFVLLPAGCDAWPTERKQVVLLHELAHVKRRDVLSLWCSRLVGAVLWFHPLVWLVIHRLRIEGERACDDLVLAAGTRPSTYSQHLVEIASAYRCSGWIAATAMSIAGRSQLEDRIRCVLDENRNRCSMSLGAAAAAVLLSLGIATTVATAGRVVVRDAAGKAVATLDIPQGGSVTIELDGNSAAQRKLDVHSEGPIKSGSQWPQWGGTPQRNNASPAARLPDSWNVKTGENILWSAELGSQTYGTPVVADGKIFIGTNNGHGYIKRFPKETDLGCLLCFDVETGKFLWQHSNKKLETGRVHDWPLQGIVSTPVVQGNRLYYVTNRAVVTCLDTGGLRDGNAGPVGDEHDGEFEADVVWQYDLMKELGVSPKNISGCSPTTDGRRLFVTTSNGTDESYLNIPAPDAPSFVCLELKTGKLLWSAKAAFAARDCQWSGPSVGTFTDRSGNRQAQVLFPGSDGWLYSFDPEGDGRGHARLLWKFDCNPKDARYVLGGRSRRNLHVSMPVIHNGLVYVATGRNPIEGEGEADLWCIDPNRKTPGSDISEFLVSDKNGKPLPVDVKSYYDEKQGHKKRVNPDSGVVWHYTATDRNGDGRTEFEETFHRTWGNPVIHNGLLVVSDFSGLVHCLRADSGKLLWTYDLYSACWSSPLAADGRIFAADEDGDVVILKLDQTLKLVEELNCGNGIYSTPVAVGDTLFVATKTRLLAIRQDRPPAAGTGNIQGALGNPRPSPGSDAGQRGVATSLPENLKLRWKLPSADGWASSAAVVGNRVYAASLAGELYCVNVHSGKTVWKYRSLDDPGPEESAPGFTSAPRVTGDAVYVGDEDGLFHAVDRATGKRKWVLETGDAITGRAAVAGDRIVFGSYDSYLYCVNTDGSLLWKFQTDDRIHGSPVIAGGYALVAGCDQHVRVIDVSAGEQVADISLDSYLIASPAVAGDEFYIGTYAGDVVAVNWKDGRISWRYKYDKRASPYHASASVTDSRVFVGGRDKQFHCLNRANGARVWTFSARAPINSSSAVVGDRVFFGSDDGNLYGLRTSDGMEVWRFRGGKKITAGVAVGDGHLVVGEEGPNGNLYCFAAEG